MGSTGTYARKHMCHPSIVICDSKVLYQTLGEASGLCVLHGRTPCLLGLIIPAVLRLVLARASPSGKARASQARMRGFESRRPLQAYQRPVSIFEAGFFDGHA